MSESRSPQLTADVVVIGGGAAGLFCAGVAGQRGRRVRLLDHAPVLGEKIRISGGGRCNFTNLHTGPQHFLCRQAGFVEKILRRYSSQDFISLVQRHGIGFHEKHRGQLFCNDSAQQIISMLHREAEAGRVELRHPVDVKSIRREGEAWRIQTSHGSELAESVVIATGGLPVPKIGATAFGLDLARELGLAVEPPMPALVPLALTAQADSPLTALSGVAVEVSILAGGKGRPYGGCSFQEDLLLTHKGFSGPAVLQASSYWDPGEPIEINWVPESALEEGSVGRRTAVEAASEHLPRRLAEALLSGLAPEILERRWAELGRVSRQQVRDRLLGWTSRPASSLGWNKAEVMRGGVSTRELRPQTLEARSYPGLYFIGECVDVTGHLGGHNFQWAWASGFVAGMSC